MSNRPYTKDGRLADVLVLIQVLALGEATKRSEEGIDTAVLAAPSSGESWPLVAAEHPEFFRVDLKRKHPLSLVARYAMPLEGEHRPPFSSKFTSVLLQTAIDLHDRQVKAADWWKRFLVPLLAAVLGGVLTGAPTYLASRRAVSVGRFVEAQDIGNMLLDTSTGKLCKENVVGAEHDPLDCTNVH